MEIDLTRTNPSWWLHEQSWPEVKTYLESDDVVLLPVGATEQHGNHLPLFVDTGWAIAVSEEAAKHSKVLIAPPLHVAISHHHMGFPGTLTLRPETLTQVVVDIGQSLLFHGFRKIVIVNGNRIANLPPLDIAAARLRHGTGAYVAVVDVALIAKREVFSVCGNGGLGHAADCETSFMQHRYPEHVHMERAVWNGGGHASAEKKYAGLHVTVDAPFDANTAFVWPTVKEYYDATEKSAGVGSDPRNASAEKGEKVLSAIVRNLSEFIDKEVRPAKVSVAIPGVPV